jgi:DNA repair protein SbcC/Rad50
MIQTQHILKVLKDSFNEVNDLNGTLLRCIQIHKQKPISYYYFDTSEYFLKPDFDLARFQEQFISHDYYKTSGWVQWNFYLIFLYNREANTSIANIQQIQEKIEKDKEYTRKFIIPDNQFSVWINSASGGQNHASAPRLRANIASRWLEKLDVAGLSAINSKIGRDSVVNTFIENGNISIPSYKSRNDSFLSRKSLPFIDSLEISNFRQNTITGHYPLGAVTLLVGPNGTGKTSFLEAIELCYCGRCFRSNNKPDPEAIVAIHLKDGSIMAPEPDTAIYRNRDAEWYNTSYEKVNRLSFNFARYNYFDTDAAYRLAFEDNKDEIEVAFSRLVLGEQVDYLEKQIKNVNILFEREAVRRKNAINELRERLAEMQSELSRLQSETPASIISFSQISESLLKLNWKYKASELSPKELEDTLRLLTKCVSSLKESCMLEIALKRFSISSLNEETDRIEKLIPQVKIVIDNFRNYEKEEEILSQEIKIDNKGLSFYTRLLTYLTDERIKDLLGLSLNIQTARETLLKLNESIALTKGFDYSFLQNSNKTLGEFITGHEHMILDNKAKIDILQENVTQLSKKVTSEKALRANIIGSMEDLLNVNPDLEICPICGTQHPVGIIGKKLHKQVALATEAEIEIKESTNKLTKYQIEISKSQRFISQLKILKTALYSTGLAKDAENLISSSAFVLYESILDNCKEKEDLLKRLKIIESYMHEKGFAEEEFNQLYKEFLSRSDNNLPIDNAKSEVIKAIGSIKENIAKSSARLDQIQVELKEARQLITSLSRQIVNRELSAPELLNALQRKIELIGTACAKICAVREHISFEDDADIFVLHSVINRLQETISVHITQSHKAEQETENVRILQERISKDKRLLEKNEAQLTNCDKAISVLTDILETDSTNKAMEDFSGAYRSTIMRTFLQIQSPREFDELELGSSAFSLNETYFAVKRRLTSKWASLNQISTGQRSALALSVFLSLNLSAETAPPIILLDDPIAHTDDLNILNFFDYLRVLSIQGARQIVFATADDKVAYLFKTKFSFLEDNFAVYER